MDGCKNNPQKSSTIKISERFPSGVSMSTISLFKDIESKHDVYRGKDCMKKFCESLREHVMNIINFKKKKMKLLTNKQQESYEMEKSVIFFLKKKYKDKCAKDKRYRKVRDHCDYTGE